MILGGDDVREIKEPGIFRKLLSEMGGRSFVLVVGFSFLVMSLASGLLFRAEFEPDHWLAALTTCKWVVLGLISKRVAEEIGEAFGRNGKG
jgi:hypothetical protein